jgi:hypothetical protein
MRDVTLYYVPDVGPDNITGKPVEVLRPKIPIRLSLNRKILPHTIEALFDTGSDRNLFPAGFASALGINVKKGKLQKIGGIGGSEITAYTHPAVLYVGTYKINTEIDFSINQGVPILGRAGFMDKFEKIEINEKKKCITLFYN